MKGIILAGGLGTRLYPLTLVLSKQLLPVYDKPMIYYPLSTLMLAGIRDILLISNPQHLASYQALLQDGSHLGLNICYQSQEKPTGLPEAFVLGEEFIDSQPCCLILGDNIFYANHLTDLLKEAAQLKKGAITFAFHVSEPQHYGVVEFDEKQQVLSLEEKPERPKSHYALTGLYFCDASVCQKAKSLKPSKRGETEIIELHQLYLGEGTLQVKDLGRGSSWFDAGSHASLLEVSQFVQSVENRQGYRIGCIEEAAFRNGWITAEELEKLAYQYKNNGYGQYILRLSQEGV